MTKHSDDHGAEPTTPGPSATVQVSRREFVAHAVLIGGGLVSVSGCLPQEGSHAEEDLDALQQGLQAPFTKIYPARATVTNGASLTLHYLTNQRRVRIKIYKVQSLPDAGPVHTSAILPTTPSDLTNQDDVPLNGTPAHQELNWKWTMTYTITASWGPGVYYAVLEGFAATGSTPVVDPGSGAGGEFGKSLFVVRPTASSSAILYKLNLATYHAYNRSTPSGSSLYHGQSDGSAPAFPGSTGARHPGYRVTALRPGGGTGGNNSADGVLNRFIHADDEFIKWLELRGIAVDFCTDFDVHHDPKLLSKYRLMLSVGHDEYWSKEMRDNVDAFLLAGGNVAFLSGNIMFWRIYFGSEKTNDSATGYPDYFVCNKVDTAETSLCNPSDPGGEGADNWYHDPRPENFTTGMTGRLGGWIHPKTAGQFGYEMQRVSEWPLMGLGLQQGVEMGAAQHLISYEFDALHYEVDPSRAVIRNNVTYTAFKPTGIDKSPKDFVILGQRNMSTTGVPMDQGCVLPGEVDTQSPTPAPFPQSAVMGFFAPCGTVFTAGTTEWVPALLEENSESGPLCGITRNVLSALSEKRSVRALADLNQNGQLDVLFTTTTQYGTAIGVWYQQNGGVARGKYIDLTQQQFWALGGASRSQAGERRLYFQNLQTGDLATWLLKGPEGEGVDTGHFVTPPLNKRYRLVGCADFNRNGEPDLLFYDAAIGEVVVQPMLGGFAQGAPITLSKTKGNGWNLIGAADFNGDGSPDLVFFNTSTRVLQVWLMTGTTGTTFSSEVQLDKTPAVGLAAVAVGDLNADGRPELILQDTASGALRVWYLIGAPATRYAFERVMPWRPAANGSITFRGWTKESSGGTNKGDTPVLCPTSDGQLASFIRASDGAIKQNVHSYTQSWQGETSLSGLSVAAGDRAAVATYADGRMVVFVRAQDGTVRFNRQNASGIRSWSGWQTLAGLVAEQGDTLAVARAGDGRLCVLARAAAAAGAWSAQAINWETQPGSGQWNGWQAQPEGGTLRRDTSSLARLSSGAIASFARGVDGLVYKNVHTFQSSWQGWDLTNWNKPANSVQVANGDGVVTAVYPDGRLLIFVRDTAGAVRYRVQVEQDPSLWSAWSTVPGLTVANGNQLAAGSTRNGNVVVVARNSSGKSMRALETAPGVWSSWSELSGLTIDQGDAVSLANDGAARVVVANRTSASGLGLAAVNWQQL